MFEPADGFERLASYRAQRSKHEIDAAQVGVHHDGRHEPIVNVERAKARRRPANRPTFVDRSHGTDRRRGKWRGQAGDALTVHADVAVRNDNDVVPRASTDIGEIRGLAIGAGKRAVDDEPQVAARQFGD